MAGRLVLTSYQGGKLKSARLPGVSDYPSARLVAGLGGGVGVVGLSEKGVVYVRQDPADPTRLVPKSVYGRNQMTAGSGSTVGLVGLRGVWCDGALHLLWYAVYRDHTDCEHRVVTGL